MKNHWDQHLTVRDLVLEKNPKCIVELGAGGGENTRQYLSLGLPFSMVVISDGICPDDLANRDNFKWLNGVSFDLLETLADDSIDFCSIDTDHNYWTLKKEFEALDKKLKAGGMVVLHDTETYWKNSGVQQGFQCGHPYPPEIHEYHEKGLSMGDAINEVLDSGKYKVVKKVIESQGAMAMEKIK